MLAGIPVAADSVAELASMVSVAGAVELAERLERALDAEVNVLALTFDERAILPWPRSTTRRPSSPNYAPCSSKRKSA